ncbi:MAG: iron-sulfur cluster biosynthesis family protein [Lactobacillus sp.]|jgi:hypothetical protein|nr:iron-sulfur cluster biosynthesis family protein [Lactobacillus sp.]MCI2033003.1 iron-sulfur cluster biosynthesis family protein [Lactobacillus sp.]
MKITIKPEALAYLRTKMGSEERLFLALDDGSSKYSQLGGSCAIGNKYQLVISDQADADYALPLDNDAGLALTTGDLEEMYLGQGLVLDYQLASLALRDNSGILDGAVMVSRPVAVVDDAALRAQRQELGNKIC